MVDYGQPVHPTLRPIQPNVMAGQAPPAITQQVTSGLTVTTRAPETAGIAGEFPDKLTHLTPVTSSGGGSLVPVDQGIGTGLAHSDHFHIPSTWISPGLQVSPPQIPQLPIGAIPPVPRINLPQIPTTGFTTPETAQAYANTVQTAAQTQRAAIQAWVNSILSRFGIHRNT